MSEHLEPTHYSDDTWGLTLWDDQTGEKCPLVVSLWDIHEGAQTYAERIAAAYNACEGIPTAAIKETYMAEVVTCLSGLASYVYATHGPAGVPHEYEWACQLIQRLQPEVPS